MDRRVTEEHDQAEICESCGGSGLTHTVYGPFYGRDRKGYREHIAARHEAMKLVDRLLARRFKYLQRSKIADAIESLGSLVVGIEEAWHEGDVPTVRANALELASAAIWILEADGAATE